MSDVDLKNKIIENIEKADKNVLEEILDWLNFERNNKVYQTNDFEKSIIKEAQEQINNGNSQSNEQIDKETVSWLEE